MAKEKVYFVADIHLGLALNDPEQREKRFVELLSAIRPEDTLAVYLLGDIWDFWYEYRDVVPRCGARVVSRLIELVDKGVDVFFVEGNHDIWTFSFFEQVGIRKILQPYYTQIGGRTFCLGHGDGLGKTRPGYALMLKVFRSKVAQAIFSTIHPTVAFRLAHGWSGSNRKTHKPYVFKDEQEPLYRYAMEKESLRHADVYVFGHYHVAVDLTLPSGSRFIILKDWIDGGSPVLEYDVSTGELRCSDGLS